MNKIFSGLVFLLLLFSCNSEEFVQSNEESQITESSNVSNFKVSPEEAVERLQDFLSGVQSRASSNINIQSIEVFTKEKCNTRALSTNTPDTLMYAINFSDNEGFAIMSADKRTEPIFVLTENGNYNFQEETGNIGFDIFMEMTKNYIVGMTNETDTTLPFAETRAIGSEWDLYKEKEPKLKYKWNQNSPYNMYTPIQNGAHTPVGCVAVAIGMCVARANSISEINGYPIDLSGGCYTTTELNADPAKAQNVARLLREIGRNMNMDYQTGGSGTSIDAAESFLKNESNIKYVTDFMPFGDQTTTRYLWDCLVLSTGGGVAVITGANSQEEAHMWVLDGIKVYKQGLSGKELCLYHCNWGWGGSFDGWYLQAIYEDNYTNFSGSFTDDAPRSSR